MPAEPPDAEAGSGDKAADQDAAPADRLRTLEVALDQFLRSVAARRAEALPGLIEVAEAVLVVPMVARRSVMGSFVPSCWHFGAADLGEVGVNLLYLNLGAGEIADTLIHELAHAYNQAMGVSGTSRGGRYHNARWGTVARELGLKVVRDARNGHRSAGLAPDASVEFADLIAMLERALVLTRDGVQRRTRTQTVVGSEQSQLPDARYMALVCRCTSPRGRGRVRIRIASGLYRPAVIVCTECDTPFVPGETT